MYATNFQNLDDFETYAKAHNSKLLIVLIPPVNATNSGVSVYGPQEQYMNSMHIPYVDLTDEMHSYYRASVSRSTGERIRTWTSSAISFSGIYFPNMS